MKFVIHYWFAYFFLVRCGGSASVSDDGASASNGGASLRERSSDRVRGSAHVLSEEWCRNEARAARNIVAYNPVNKKVLKIPIPWFQHKSKNRNSCCISHLSTLLSPSSSVRGFSIGTASLAVMEFIWNLLGNG
jgi:hypothetical protein